MTNIYIFETVSGYRVMFNEHSVLLGSCSNAVRYVEILFPTAHIVGAGLQINGLAYITFSD